MVMKTIIEGDGYTKEATLEINRGPQTQGKIVQDAKGVGRLQRELGLSDDGMIGKDTTIALQKRLAEINGTGKYDARTAEALAQSANPQDQALGKALAGIKPGVLDQSYRPYTADELKVTLKDIENPGVKSPDLAAPKALDADELGAIAYQRQREAERQARRDAGAAGAGPEADETFSIGNAEGYKPQDSPDIGAVIDAEEQRATELAAQSAALKDSDPDMEETPGGENPFAGKSIDEIGITTVTGPAEFDGNSADGYTARDPVTRLEGPATLESGFGGQMMRLDGVPGGSQPGLDEKFQQLMNNIVGTVKSWGGPPAQQKPEQALEQSARVTTPKMEA